MGIWQNNRLKLIDQRDYRLLFSHNQKIVQNHLRRIFSNIDQNLIPKTIQVSISRLLILSVLVIWTNKYSMELIGRKLILYIRTCQAA